MKNVIIILNAVLLITAINACTLQEIPESGNPGAITITCKTVLEQAMSNLPGSKNILSGVETHWISGDKIGVFSPEAKPTSESAPPTKNAESTALTETPAKSSSFTSSLVWGSDSDHHFYAYYPYGTEYTSAQTAEVPISLASAQNQSGDGNKDHIGALDFMVATPKTVTPPGVVNLPCNHVFSIMEFQITASGSLSAVRLTGTNALACTGTIDLTQTPGVDDIAYTIAQTSTSQTVTVTLGSAASLSTTTAVSVFMMILPGTQSGDITIELEIGGSWKSMTKTPPAGGFVRGKKYNIAVLHDSRDGNLYSYKTIGTQVWMTKNLAYLPAVSPPNVWSNTEPYYYVYGYSGTVVSEAKATTNYSTYGVLYNWIVAMNGAASSSSSPSGVQGVCPDGWHLPSEAEWTTLINYLGISVAGGKMKEAGTTHWLSPNTGATNESGFTGLPGGYKHNNSTFYYLGTSGNWWTTYGIPSLYDASYISLHKDVSSADIYSTDYQCGHSVRCVMD
jgi:uncharacterized protein (TIGR02145 family)